MRYITILKFKRDDVNLKSPVSGAVGAGVVWENGRRVTHRISEDVARRTAVASVEPGIESFNTLCSEVDGIFFRACVVAVDSEEEFVFSRSVKVCGNRC